ncbi:MAG: TlpA disulfide reductase family protein [Dehalococcoidia bacterium]
MPDDPVTPATLLDRPMVRAGVALVLLAALAAAAFAIRSTGDDGAAPAAGGAPLGALDARHPVRGQPAPDFALLTTDGRVLRLSDFRGKVVYVNFWATWCTPCKKELPAIQRIYDEKHAEGFEVLTVNWLEDSDNAAAFFEERELTLPVLLDSDGDVYDQYALQGLPDSFFVDRQGNIAAINYGYLPEETMRARLATAGLP